MAYISVNDTFLFLPPESSDPSISFLNQGLKNNKNKFFALKLNWKNIEVLKLYNFWDF
jgi:hypothetical protein